MTIDQSDAAEAGCLDGDVVHNLGVGVEDTKVASIGVEVESHLLLASWNDSKKSKSNLSVVGAESPQESAAVRPRVGQAHDGADGEAMGSLCP